MRKYFYKFGCGIASSLLGGFFFFLIGSALANGFPDINLGGDKAGGLWGILIGMPLGSLGGFLIVDKYFYQFKSYNFLGLVIGLVGGFLIGGIGGIFLLDAVGGKAIVLIPLLIVASSMAGYQIGFKRVSRSDSEGSI